jgi:hypothetical protein
VKFQDRIVFDLRGLGWFAVRCALPYNHRQVFAKGTLEVCYVNQVSVPRFERD